MNEEPPKCVLGCCNVRSWTLVVSIINIVLLILSLIEDIRSITQSPTLGILQVTVHTFLLYVNEKLRRGVKEHDIAPIRLWLWVQLSVVIVWGFAMTVDIVIISTGCYQNTKYQNLQEHVPSVIIIYIIFEGIIILWSYPVYQFYIFEKTRLQVQQTGIIPLHQTI